MSVDLGHSKVSLGSRLHKEGVAVLVMNLHIGADLKDDADHFLVAPAKDLGSLSAAYLTTVARKLKLDTNASATFTPLRRIDPHLD